MNKINTQFQQWENINRQEVKKGILKTTNQKASEGVIADFDELLAQVNSEYNSQYKGLRTFAILGTDNTLTKSNIKNLLANYKAISKRYDVAKLLSSKGFDHTKIKDDLHKITSSVYYSLKKAGVSQSELNILRPFLKSDAELAVERKYHNHISLKFSRCASEHEVEIKGLSEAIEKENKEMQMIKNSKSGFFGSNIALEVSRKEQQIKNFERVMNIRQAQLENIYRAKQQFVRQAIIEVSK